MFNQFVSDLSLVSANFNSLDSLPQSEVCLFVLASFAAGFGLGCGLCLFVRLFYGIGMWIGHLMRKYR